MRYNDSMELRDAHGRTIRDLRISLTDRCNFRCFYCLPNVGAPHAQKESILTFEEIARIAGILVSMGVSKIRLTGGEPLLRRDVYKLVGSLSALKPDLADIALTTNGFSLPRQAASLKDAGLDRITISLDALDQKVFAQITGVDGLDKTLAAIECARSVGLSVKINAVIVRGRNEDQIIPLAAFAREKGHSMRFIEFMPLDSDHGWTRDRVVTGGEILAKISQMFPLVPKERSCRSSTAVNFRFADGSPGEIGIIAPVSEPFCGACSRIRITADGKIRTCLFSTTEYDLRDLLRNGADDGKIVDRIVTAVGRKQYGHSINDPQFAPASRSMSFIGG